MRLRNIQVENYRSITKTQNLLLDDGLTVILGPNNEGKSNLLKAVALGMECIRTQRIGLPSRRRRVTTLRGALPSSSYDWKVDFPIRKQTRHAQGQTVITLTFELTAEEQAQFRSECGSSINTQLPIEIRLGASGLSSIEAKKQGRGGKAFKRKLENIVAFVSQRIDVHYIPALRPTQMSLRVVREMIDRELFHLKRDPDYAAALETIKRLQQPTFDRIGCELKEHLSALLPTVKSVTLQYDSVGHLLPLVREPICMIDDGIATELESKGEGMQSLVAVSLLRAARADEVTGDIVVAIDEPEAHLHPGAVRHLAQMLREMAESHQVIISTHNPLLVVRDRVSSNIIVSKANAQPAQSLKMIRDSLGVNIEDNLIHAECVILVEGDTDVAVLAKIMMARSDKFKSLYHQRRIVFDTMKGAAKVAYKLTLLNEDIVTTFLITDDDSDGRKCISAAMESGIEYKYLFQLKRTTSHETELEDIVDPDVYWTKVEEHCGGTLDRRVFESLPDKWSTRMKSTLERSGKNWNKSIESNIKRLVADSVSSTRNVNLAPGVESVLDNIIDSIIRQLS